MKRFRRANSRKGGNNPSGNLVHFEYLSKTLVSSKSLISHARNFVYFEIILIRLSSNLRIANQKRSLFYIEII